MAGSVRLLGCDSFWFGWLPGLRCGCRPRSAGSTRAAPEFREERLEGGFGVIGPSAVIVTSAPRPDVQPENADAHLLCVRALLAGAEAMSAARNRLAIRTKRAAGRAWRPAGSRTREARSPAISQATGPCPGLRHAAAPAAASATSSILAPTLAWTAATTAPSTSGASLTRTRPARPATAPLARPPG